MRSERKEKRKAEIEAVTFQLLEDKGFDGVSMASIARAAKTSMETLYNWYGDKTGLFSALVRRNATDVITILEAAETEKASPDDSLRITSRALLAMVSGPKAVALNRAAINDKSGVLGVELAQAGRAVVGPRVAALLLAWKMTGAVTFDDPREAAAVYINLLIGDHQIRRATGAVPPLTADEVAQRTDRAIDLFQRIFGGSAVR